MFVPLKISVDEINTLKLQNDGLLIPRMKEKTDSFYEGILSQVIKDDVIDGSNLSSLTFPFDRDCYDVFISYSHNDEEQALYLYTYLENRGLKCFLDSIIWHSADGLLREIDRNFCHTTDGKYFDYEKRNFSTSHVHAMLSMAMLEGIKISECCIFIESSNSVSLKDGIAYKTLSPWIYEEISFAKNCQISVPERYRLAGMRIFCEGGRIELNESESRILKIAYDINLDDFQTITWQDIFEKRGTDILDSIYKRYGIIQKIKQNLLS